MECKSDPDPVYHKFMRPKIVSPGSCGSNISLSISALRGANTPAIFETNLGNSPVALTKPTVGFWRELISLATHRNTGHTKHSSG